MRIFHVGCLIFFLSSALFSKAQVLFDATGKLTQLKVTSVNKKNVLGDFDATTLKDADKKIKEIARKTLLTKLDEALKVIKDRSKNPGLYDFLNACWGDLTPISQYLNNLKTAINTQDASRLIDALEIDFSKPISDHLFDNSTSVFSRKYDVVKPIKISLWKEDPFASCIIDYYNKTLSNMPSLTLADVLDRINYLRAIQQRVNNAIKEGRRSDIFREDVYKRLRDLHLNLQSPPELYSIIKNEFNDNWFKQWFWFRGGEISLNPFDFTAAEFLKNNPQFDVAKANLYDQYIDSLIQRQLRYDTTGHIKDFEEKLRLQHTGENLYSFKGRNDSLVKLNQEKMSSFLETNKLLNKVEIPEKESFYNFSAVTDINFLVDKQSLQESLRKDESKQVVLHNIITGVPVGLLETNKAIEDKSDFQIGFDTVISQLGKLGALALQLNPYNGILNYARPVDKPGTPNITPPKSGSQGAAFIWARNFIDFGNGLKVIYPSDISTFKEVLRSFFSVGLDLLDDPPGFDNLFSGFDYNSKQVRDSKFLKSQAFDRIKQYLALIMANEVINLQKDSLLTANFLSIYNRPPLPSNKPLEKSENNTPVYYSKIMSTAPSDEAIQKTVKIYSVPKDTVTIDKFTYKVGKNERLKLGAGIAYTLNSYDQATATESNGEIKITNNVKQYRFIVGLHIYLGKGLYSQENKLWKWKERNFIFLGIGIPDPLGNLYLGLGHDIVPGLKLVAGVHIAKNNKYLIQNNTIVEETARYQAAGPFIGLTIDPVGFINLLNVFKK